MPESNFVSASKSGALQQIQLYVPSSLLLLYSPEKGASVPCSLHTRNSSSVSCFLHSSLVFFILKIIPYLF